MSKVEERIRSGHYRTVAIASMAINRAKLPPKEKARLRGLLNQYKSRDQINDQRHPIVQEMRRLTSKPDISAGTKVPEKRVVLIRGIERVAALMYVTAAKNGATIDELVKEVKEYAKNWGID